MPHRLATHNALPAASALMDFRHLVDGMPTPYIVMDRSLNVVYANQAYLDTAERKLSDLIGKNVFRIFPDTDDRTAPIREAFIRTLNGETTRLDQLYYHFRHADGTYSSRCWRSVQTPYYDSDGEVAYIIQHPEDITEADKLRQRNEMIQRELDHRVKNLFSVIQAVAMMSGTKAETIDQFREEFADRLAAMGSTYDQLREQNWDGLWLHDILRDGLRQFCGDNCDKVTISGPNVRLSTRGAENASLLVHEMATNAAKYGCFSVPEGRLNIRTDYAEDPHSVHMSWKESGMTGIKAPETTGFGTRLFQSMQSSTSERLFEEDGLHVKLTAKLLHPMETPKDFSFSAL